MGLGPIGERLRRAQSYDSYPLPLPDTTSDEAFEEMMGLITNSLKDKIGVPFSSTISLEEVLSKPEVLPFLDDIGEARSPLVQSTKEFPLGRVMIITEPTRKTKFVFSPFEGFRLAELQGDGAWLFSRPKIDHTESLSEITALRSAGELYDVFSEKLVQLVGRYNFAKKTTP